MSSGFSDKLKGAGNKLKGELKEAIGEKTNDPELQAQGKLDQLKGEAQETISNVKEAISKKLDK